MERLQDRPQRREPQATGGGIPTEAATDVAAVARDAARQAADVPLAPSGVAVEVKTTGAHSTHITATPDTPLVEILTQACHDLGVRDPERYVLVARGEVLGERRTLAQVLGETPRESEITMRLVKKPEAGAPRCRF
jgi:hypothetical protein